jgi:hypothetical protein
MESRALLRVAAGIRDAHANVHVQLIAAIVDQVIDMRRHLTPHHRPDETHQPLWFPQLAPPYGLDHNQERIVDLIIQLLRPKLAAQVKPDASREHRVEVFHS